MNTQKQDQQNNNQGQPGNNSNGSKYDDQDSRQKQSAFDEGLADNDDTEDQPSRNTDPEIDTPIHNPEKTEKKIPDMKGNK